MKLVYLTFNDHPSGIYKSQVVDTCAFLREELDHEVQLIAFISLRKYNVVKRAIREMDITAKVYPMFPGIHRWRNNKWLLRLSGIRNADKVIARGMFATHLAHLAGIENQRLIFDARGAYAAEFSEYRVGGDMWDTREIESLEQSALQISGKQLAVSDALRSYWKRKYSFDGSNSDVIPCTLSDDVNIELPDEQELLNYHAQLGVQPDECLIAFSGTASGWHSFQMMDALLTKWMRENPKIKLLLLTSSSTDQLHMCSEFPERVIVKWVKHQQVQQLLHAADYGWLVREASDTNRVASPVKFAEYLAAGLYVIISPELGDYSELVHREGCGMISDKVVASDLIPLTRNQKLQAVSLVKKHFTKKALVEQYKNLLR
jgi:hypothetical protein